ncbi:MAG: hypothetical protein M3070_17980 [Actinomycetota bacterium]|nr:hypothetical protein [Actinomycetota bacterium]
MTRLRAYSSAGQLPTDADYRAAARETSGSSLGKAERFVVIDLWGCGTEGDADKDEANLRERQHHFTSLNRPQFEANYLARW